MTDDAMERTVERVAARVTLPRNEVNTNLSDRGYRIAAGLLRDEVAQVLSALSPEDAADLAVAKGSALPWRAMSAADLVRRHCWVWRHRGRRPLHALRTSRHAWWHDFGPFRVRVGRVR